MIQRFSLIQLVLKSLKVPGTDFSMAWDHPFSTYATFSKKLTFLTPDIHTYLYVLGIKNISFL